MQVKSQSEVAQSCPTLSDPKDCSPPGSSVHGIFQARVLEWGAIAFSNVETNTWQKTDLQTQRTDLWLLRGNEAGKDDLGLTNVTYYIWNG